MPSGHPFRGGILLGLLALLLVACDRAPAGGVGVAREFQGSYESIGQGMGATLTVANEKLAYTLSDRGTFVARLAGGGPPPLELVVLVAGDPLLFNPYGVIAVNPARHPSVNFPLAQEFIRYLTSYDTQRLIADYRKGGQVLFHPDSDQWKAGDRSYRPPATPPAAGQRLLLATTTSTRDSGLLDYLLPPFEGAYNAHVEVIAVGTGQAIATAERGDADVVLVHERGLEDRFVAEGYGVGRQDVMYNDFVLLGPPGDPAGVRGMGDAAAAFARVARARATFISRGDGSGTHVKELEVWRRAGIEPQPRERRYRRLSG